MDDEVDFFTRRPLSNKSKAKAKAKPKALASALNGSLFKAGEASGSHLAQPTSSATSTSTSAVAAVIQLESSDDEDHIDMLQDNLVDDDDDDDAVLLSSDLDVASDDSDASAKRRAKRRKKRHAKTLPAWASQGHYTRPSQEPSSSYITVVDDALPSSSRSNGASTDTAQNAKAGTDASTKSSRRARGVSLTPPPPPSPEKLSMARELVNRTIASKFGTAPQTSTTIASSSSTDSASRRATRSTRNSATPAFGQDLTSAVPGGAPRTADDEDDETTHVHWDPDLARLMRGENAKHLREQAKREQQERDERRRHRELERLRQQPSSLPGPSQRQSAFARTQSAPQTRILVADGGESDDSVEYVPRLTKPASSPRRTRSAAAHTAAACIVIDDSDDDTTLPSASHTNNRSGDDGSDGGGGGEGAGETLSLTLQSKLGAMPVTVTPTTKLQTIIAHWHAQKLSDFGGVKVANVRVSFDGFGYTPNQTVQDMDVEDGDQIELSWS